MAVWMMWPGSKTGRMVVRVIDELVRAADEREQEEARADAEASEALAPFYEGER